MTDNVPDLVTSTAELMRSRRNSIKLRQIAEECHVSITWLSKLQTDKLEDAPAGKVERVRNWLLAKAESQKAYR